MMEKVVHFIYCLLDPLLTERAHLLESRKSIEGHSTRQICLSNPLNIKDFSINSTNHLQEEVNSIRSFLLSVHLHVCHSRFRSKVMVTSVQPSNLIEK